MDAQTVQRFLDGMQYEANRTGPPESFPQLPDIPGGRYVDPAFLAAERDYVWKRSWLYACHADELAASGKLPHVAQDRRRRSFLVRGKDDVVRAFYNTCRHRGAPVVKSRIGPRRRARVQLSRLDVRARRQAHEHA